MSKLKADLERQFATDDLDRLLGLAATKGDRYLIATLLSLGADPDVVDGSGLTALARAALSDSPQAASVIGDLLLYGDANPEVKTGGNATALTLAIAANRPQEIIDILASVSDLDGSGEVSATVAEIAARLGNNELAEALAGKSWYAPRIPFPKLTPVEVALTRNMGPKRISEAQKTLKSKGLYASSIDGLWGPASRRGLAAYFRVVFEDYWDTMNQFCSLVRQDLKARQAEGDELVGSGSRDGVQWTYRSSQVTASEGRQSITCFFVRGNPGLGPTSAQASRGPTRITAFFGSQCPRDKNEARTVMHFGPKDVAAEFACRKAIAGVPFNSQEQATLWYEF